MKPGTLLVEQSEHKDLDVNSKKLVQRGAGLGFWIGGFGIFDPEVGYGLGV